MCTSPVHVELVDTEEECRCGERLRYDDFSRSLLTFNGQPLAVLEFDNALQKNKSNALCAPIPLSKQKDVEKPRLARETYVRANTAVTLSSDQFRHLGSTFSKCGKSYAWVFELLRFLEMRMYFQCVA